MQYYMHHLAAKIQVHMPIITNRSSPMFQIRENPMFRPRSQKQKKEDHPRWHQAAQDRDLWKRLVAATPLYPPLHPMPDSIPRNPDDIGGKFPTSLKSSRRINEPLSLSLYNRRVPRVVIRLLPLLLGLLYCPSISQEIIKP